VASKPAFEGGEPGQFFVRSENVQVGAGENTVSGTIQNVVYRGELTDYTLELETGDRFTATLSNTEYAVGEELTVSWDGTDTVALVSEEIAVEIGTRTDSTPKAPESTDSDTV